MTLQRETTAKNHSDDSLLPIFSGLSLVNAPRDNHIYCSPPSYLAKVQSSQTRYYAVVIGITPGIYTDWLVASPNVIGIPGSIYKSFATYKEALASWKSHCLAFHLHPDSPATPDKIQPPPQQVHNPDPFISGQPAAAVPPRSAGSPYQEPSTTSDSSYLTRSWSGSDEPASTVFGAPTLQLTQRQLSGSAGTSDVHLNSSGPTAEVLESKELLYVVYNLVYVSQCIVYTNRAYVELAFGAATKKGLQPEVCIVRSLEGADDMFRLRIMRSPSNNPTFYYAVRGSSNIIYGTRHSAFCAFRNDQHNEPILLISSSFLEAESFILDEWSFQTHKPAA